MAAKKKQAAKAKWSVIFFGVFVFIGVGLGALTAYYAGATHQLNTMQTTNAAL